MEVTTIWISIITSLLASIVFWFVFNFLPWIGKQLRIRPRIENDIIDIQLYLLFFIQIPFLQSLHTSSVFQSDIVREKLGKDNFENALYGKCLSAERCIGEFEHRLLPVGEELISSAEQLDKRLDRIQRYSDYLSTREILVLKEIGDRIHAYDFVEHKDVIDGMELVPVDPTISYMRDNFYELYLLYHKLNGISASYCLAKRNEYENYLIAKRELEDRHYLRLVARKFFLNRGYQILIDMRYYFLQGKKGKAKQKLQEYLEQENQKLVYLRGVLDDYLLENEFIGLLETIRGADEVQEWTSCVNSEILSKKNMELRNAENKSMIHEKLKNNPKITEYDNKKINMLNKLFNGYL
ncbi:hypothetical protein [Butyrivibrio sp. AC2005]|uniref:hypothetical protein n=1 Tax=Butyrivibrio sp. AC2005 TaxID=1280672 RepID=UPI00040182E0|nr:hypothetical protein [Butyrivibrio sp. AC2005]